jgi:hypothetical protein
MKQMSKTDWLINGLFIVYVSVLTIFIGITILGSKNDIDSFVINAIIFITVFLIFYFSRRNMKKVQQITMDLIDFTNKINRDYKIENKYLWEKYQNENIDFFFKNCDLKENYKKYIQERKRLAILSENNYKCSIEEYINDELIDSVMKKNVLNLVPGVMTGLGILGTFIGLSIGLQNFNTGTSEEITASIVPLMNGIKVAFHTSIYGMIFSLVFNFVYKEVLEDAYIAVEKFLQAFDNYVDSDADSDNKSVIQIMFQKMPETIGEKVAEILNPAVERMNNTLENFTRNIADSQVQGVAEIVDRFMESMNTSLGDSFKNLGIIIDETCELQKKNNEMLTNTLEQVDGMTHNIKDINILLNLTLDNMAGYVDKIEKLQGIINENFKTANAQFEYQKDYDEKLKEYIDILVNYERQIGEASNKFTEDMSKQLEMLSQMENKISESTRKNLELLAGKAEDYNKSLTETAKQELQSILSLANDYSEKVVVHLNSLESMSEKITAEASNNLQVLSRNAELYNKTLADSTKQQMKEILDLSDRQTGDMDKVAKELAAVSQQLNGKLVVSLNTAFGAIDENLAEITKHLSGTISEIDATTERVPQVVKNSYDGMKTTFDDMREKYEDLINALDRMAENVNQRNTSLQLSNAVTEDKEG